MTEWEPLSARQSGDEEKYHALSPGVPAWLEQSLWNWVSQGLSTYSAGRSSWNTRSLLELERKLRINVGADSNVNAAVRELRKRCINSETFFLDVVDAQLSTLGFSNDREARRAEGLIKILKEGGSLWQVSLVRFIYRLEQRVDTATRSVAIDAMAKRGQASVHLREAWHSAFGINPSAGKAYSESVKAVEAAAWPVISPKNKSATLGTMISDFKKNSKNWDVAIAGKKLDSRDTVVKMMQTLWEGHTDRHGTSKPVEPSQIASEGAVILAVTLVQWFTRGVVKIAGT